RDKSVKVWARIGATWAVAATLKLEQPATAVALTSGPDGAGDILAVGTEAGSIEVFAVAASAITPLAAVPAAQ
ncbi:hypothetical protein NY592_01245, partial [Enterobacter hormaechei]|uniref:hypothetical protein n=1 Tax=Enterobacter hormaechei TaxID=158836 RepID=UPI0022F0B8B5